MIPGVVAGAAVVAGDTPIPPEGAGRYWRVHSITIGGAGDFLEISELQLLLDGVVVSEGQSYSSTYAPTSSLENLFDGSVDTRCYWSGAVVALPDFEIVIDFGLAQEVNGFRQAGYDNAGRYIAAFSLDFSDDGLSWTNLGSESGMPYPGNKTFGSIYDLP